MTNNLIRSARRVPPPRYRRTQGIPRAMGPHRRALRRMGIDVWLVNRPGRAPTLVGGRYDTSVGAMANDALTAAALKTDAVTEIQGGLAVAGEAAAALASYDGPTDAEMLAALAALNDLSAAEVNAEVDAALVGYDGPTDAEMLAAFAALENLSAAAAADAVWDELISEARPANSFGQKFRQLLALVTRGAFR